MARLEGGMSISSTRTLRGLLVSGGIVTLALSLGSTGAGASNASALAQAKTQLLKLSDLPKGWTSKKSSNGGNKNLPQDAQLASCLHVPLRQVRLNPPTAYSPEFDNGQTQVVNENIAVFASSKVAQTQYGMATNAKTPVCYARILNGSYKRQFEAGFGNGASVGTVTGTPISSADYAANTGGFTLSFTVTEQGVSLVVKTSQVYAIKGREGMQLSFTSIGAPFTAALTQQVTAAALAKL